MTEKMMMEKKDCMMEMLENSHLMKRMEKMMREKRDYMMAMLENIH
jgi:hypothetical protein